VVDSDESAIDVAWSIVGGLRLATNAEAKIADSIVDATAPEEVAYAAPDDIGPGGTLRIERSTVIGKVHARELELASETIFWSRLGTAPGETWEEPVRVVRRQAGCVRFSWVPPSSRVPRRYRCQPDSAVAAALTRAATASPAPSPDEVRARVERSVVPLFTSERYGHEAYVQLHRCVAPEIRTGAESGTEMGAYAHLDEPLRERDLMMRLEEYLPFGLEAGIVHAT
jgi:hypothetical protein